MDIFKIGEYIKQRIKERGITQDQLANMLGVTSPAVSQVLNGKNLFDYQNMINLSKILDEPVDKIINAGEESETYLEELSKLTIENFESRDPEYKKVKDIDSKSNTFFDYLMKNKNYLLTMEIVKRGFYYNELKDIRFMTLLIENNDHDNYSKQNFQPIIYSELSKDILESQHLKPFESYNENEKNYIKAIVHSSNDAILNHFQYLSNHPQDRIYSPTILFYAVQFDQLQFIKYYEERRNINNSHLKHQLVNLYRVYFNFALTNKSNLSIKYYYDLLNEFDIKDYFNTLFATKDIEFIQDFLNTYKNKSSRGHYYNQDQTFVNYDALMPLIETNDLPLMEVAITFSNQESLDKAIEMVNPNQLEMMKVLLRKGARFSYRTGESSQNIPLVNLSALVVSLLNQIESKKK